MTTTTKRRTSAPPAPPLPPIPDDLAGWRFSTNPKTGQYFLMHPKHPAIYTTKHYHDPDKAITEARRWALSQPKPAAEQPSPAEDDEQEGPPISPDAAAARLRLRGFKVREHGLRWIVRQDGSDRILTLSPDDLALAARIAQAAGGELAIDQLADQLYAETGETPPGAERPAPPASPPPTVQYIALDDIHTNGGTQARAQLDPTTVEEYAATWLTLSHRQNGFDQMPPIVVYYDGSDYWLADGFHRVEAYTRFVDGCDSSASPRGLMAEVRQGTRRDAVLYACGANAAHGLRRTNADKRRAVETLLRDEEWRLWSNRKIADACAVDHKTVADVRDQLVATGEIPQSDERQGADGRTTNTAGITAANAGRNQPSDDDVRAMRERFYALGYEQFYRSDAGWTAYHPKKGKATYKTWADAERDIARKEGAASMRCEKCGGVWGAPGSVVRSEGKLCRDCAQAVPVPPEQGAIEPIIRVEDADLFDRAEATYSVSDGYLNRGKIKRPFEYAGKLWIGVGGGYGGAYSAHDECACVRVVVEGEPYTPGEPNRSYRPGSYTHDRASAGGKDYVLTGQWLIITRPNVHYQPGAINRPDGSPADTLPPDFDDVQRRFAALDTTLTYDAHRGFIMRQRDRTVGIVDPNWATVVDTLETRERGAAALAAAPDGLVPEYPDRASIAARLTRHNWHIQSHFGHAGTIWLVRLGKERDQKNVKSWAAVVAFADQLDGVTTPTQVAPFDPTPPPCEDCGLPSTNKRTIGGMLAHRCDACTIKATEQEQQDRAEAERADTGLAALCERAEALGAQVNYLALDDPQQVQVTAPPGYQQRPLNYTADELARQVERWEANAAPVQTAPAGPPIDYNAVARHTYALGATSDEIAAWQHWEAIGRLLARSDARSFAIHLLTTLAPLMGAYRTEDEGSLSMAISNLNECQEGSEAAHWAAVGWALLDIEAEESEAAA
jgi:hypothetical protein